MSVLLNLEKLEPQVGLEFGPSEWFSVTQEQVNLFADVTRDHQYIHIDPARAELTPFGSTVAHGFLSLSMLSHFAATGFAINVDDAKLSLNYGFDKVRFISPVMVGSRIRGKATLLSVKKKRSDQLLIKQKVVIEIENETTVALAADWLTMFVF